MLARKATFVRAHNLRKRIDQQSFCKRDFIHLSAIGGRSRENVSSEADNRREKAENDADNGQRDEHLDKCEAIIIRGGHFCGTCLSLSVDKLCSTAIPARAIFT